MPKPRRIKSTHSKCELVANPKLKRRADAAASTLRDAFPPGLARPALRALHAAGLKNLFQLAKMREADVAALHGIGPNALAKLKSGLRAQGLSFQP